MSTKSNVTLRLIEDGGIVKVNPALADAYASGDLVDFDGTDLTIHTGDNSEFLGVVIDGSEVGQTQQIAVATICQVSAKVVASSAALVLGDGVSHNAGSNGVNYDFTKNTAQGIMWAYENNIANGDFGLFYVNSHVMGAGFLFDTLTEA